MSGAISKSSRQIRRCQPWNVASFPFLLMNKTQHLNSLTVRTYRDGYWAAFSKQSILRKCMHPVSSISEIHSAQSRAGEQVETRKTWTISATTQHRLDEKRRRERREQIFQQIKEKSATYGRDEMSSLEVKVRQAMEKQDFQLTQNALLSARESGTVLPVRLFFLVAEFYGEHGLSDHLQTLKLVLSETWPNAMDQDGLLPHEVRAYWVQDKIPQALKTLHDCVDDKRGKPYSYPLSRAIRYCVLHSLNHYADNKISSSTELDELCKFASYCNRQYKMKGPLLWLFEELFYAPHTAAQKLAYKLLDAHPDVLKSSKIMYNTKETLRGIMFSLTDRAKASGDGFVLTRMTFLLEELNFNSFEEKRPFLVDLYNSAILAFCDKNDAANALKVFELSQKVLKTAVHRNILQPETIKRLQSLLGRGRISVV